VRLGAIAQVHQETDHHGLLHGVIEVPYELRPALVEDSEIVLRQVGDEFSLVVGHGHGHVDFRGLCAKGCWHVYRLGGLWLGLFRRLRLACRFRGRRRLLGGGDAPQHPANRQSHYRWNETPHRIYVLF